MDYCNFCFNAHVYEKISKEGDYEHFLDDTNDFSSIGIGNSDKHIKLYLNSGYGEAVNIETCEWGKDERWHTVAKYYPKYCPECGRKLDEFTVGDRGSFFKKIKKEN